MPGLVAVKQELEEPQTGSRVDSPITAFESALKKVLAGTRGLTAKVLAPFKKVKAELMQRRQDAAGRGEGSKRKKSEN